jgi:hypothetical protein
MRILKSFQEAFAFIAEAVLEIFSPNHDDYPAIQKQPVEHQE